MNENKKVMFDPEEEMKVSVDMGTVKFGQLAIGEVTTVEAGEEARVTNSGSPSHAILNFAIPKGERGEKGDKGDKGDIPDDYVTKEYLDELIGGIDSVLGGI